MRDFANIWLTLEYSVYNIFLVTNQSSDLIKKERNSFLVVFRYIYRAVCPQRPELRPGIVVAGRQFGKHIRKNFPMESSEEAADCLERSAVHH